MKKGFRKKYSPPATTRGRRLRDALLAKKYGFVWNKFQKRRSREYKLRLTNVIQHAKRRGAKKVILFMDHAPCHKTKNVRKIIREHGILERDRCQNEPHS